MNIIGRLTRDAVVKTLESGKRVVNFSVAVNDSYKTKEGKKVEMVEYFNCSYWKTVNAAKILTKGLLVALTGRVSASAWTAKDGEVKATLNFHTSDIKPLAGGRKGETVHATAETNPAGDSAMGEDLPF